MPTTLEAISARSTSFTPSGRILVVDDAGPGLRGEDLLWAFDPFYRADASRNLDQGGVGLGLPIARATARGHGGEVVLRPQAVGLRAIVTLPLAPRQGPKTSGRPSA